MFWQRRKEPRPLLGESTLPPAGESGSINRTSHEATGQEMYDNDLVVGNYLEFHYGPNSQFPVACVDRCINVMKEVGQPMGKALEVGGGPGRCAIELAKAFGHVCSGDYSQTFVDMGNRLVNDGELKWKVLQDRTAGVVVERSISAKDLGVGKNISFSQVDAHDLPEDHFDLICGFNLIDRLEFTPKDNWLGGFKYGDNDGPTSYEGMKELLLAEGFEEVKQPQDVWFRIDSLANGRMTQQTKAHMTFWRYM